MAMMLLASVAALPAQQPSPPASEPAAPPQGFVNLVNATGLEEALRVVINGDELGALDMGPGSDSGMIGVTLGSVVIRVSHPKILVPAEQTFPVKLNERLNVVVHASATAGEGGKAVSPKLAFLTLPSMPTPDKNTISVVNCDALNRSQTLAVNGTEVQLPPLQPVHLSDLAPQENYALTFKGHQVMAPYAPVAPDHAYFVVYVDLQNPRLNSLVVMDRRPGSPAEEQDKLKREVARRIARERAAAEWVLGEIARRTQERKEARVERQKQRTAGDTKP